SIVTGMTVGEYIRARRLSLAAQELVKSKSKVLDMALKYGYETAESFTKAFSRFHGATPSEVMHHKSNASFFAPLSINIDIRGGFNMKRKVIPNIPVIDNYGNEVDYGFNLLKALFAIAGEEIEKSELAVYSGMANRFVWTPSKWAGGNEVMDSINETPFEAEIHLLKTIGWDAKYITVHRDKDGNPLNMDNEQIRRDFVAAIDYGYPVLFQGVHKRRLNMIIGYENDGCKIIGKQAVELKEGGNNVDSETVIYEDWENMLAGYILLKEKRETTPEQQRVIELFTFVLARAYNTSDVCGKKVGFAAWESFLHDLEHDDFSTIDDSESGRRFGIYCDGLCQIWARNESLPFYIGLAQRYPGWQKELLAAADALEACAQYAGFVWSLGFTKDNFAVKFRDSAIRKILADEGRKAMQYDRAAITQFEYIIQNSL
ncbi:MAG: helix-turn-helix transcriptional regulator, partial [Defluviitaleaceae bacterium]|nr:helix-turn-helix transcriptional regulator [Defluviitaleaceae bacterium]